MPADPVQKTAMMASRLDQVRLMLRMALRGSVRRKRRSLVVAATATVGMVCVVLSQGFLNGMFDSMVLVAIETGLGHVQVRPRGYLDSRQTDLRLPEAGKIRQTFTGKLGSDVHYAGRMEREAILRAGGQTRGILLMGIEPEREGRVSSMQRWLAAGRFLSSGRGPPELVPPCMLGAAGARKWELELRDRVLITTGGLAGSTRSFRCRVVGLFQSPAIGIDERVVLMRRTDLSRIRNGGPTDEVSYFVFHGTHHTRAAQIKKRLQQILGATDFLPGLELVTYNELEPSIAQLFELYDQITVVLYFIILMGFGLVLFESVTMSIFERTREIGMIHAIGTRPSFLFALVVTEALLITLAGVLAGLGFGGLCVLALYLTGVDLTGLSLSANSFTSGVGLVRPYLTWQDPLVGLAIATCISLISSLYPALKAVRLAPIRAMHQR